MSPAYELAASDPTAVFVLSNFFTGTTPASEAKMLDLLGTIPAQELAYANAGSSDPQLAGYESLGRGLAIANPGPTLVDYTDDWFIVNTYANAFGYDANADQVQHFLDQETYFKDLYASIGIAPADALVQARGVVIGQILAFAVRTEGTPLNTAAGIATTEYLKHSGAGFEYGKNIYAYEPETVVVHEPGPVVDKADVIAKTFGGVDTDFDNATGGIYFGDGTTPSTGQASVYDPTSGSMIAVSLMPRQSLGGEKYAPTSSSFDGKTLTVEYNAPAGTQHVDNNSQANVANRGAANTNYSFGDDQSIKAFIQAGGKVEVALDTDNTTAVNQIKFLAFVAGDGTIDLARADGLPGAITDNGGTDMVFSNSQQQNFFTPNGVADLTPGAQFTNSFTISEANGALVVGITEIVNLVGYHFSPTDQLS